MKRFKPDIKVEAYHRAIDFLRASEDGTTTDPCEKEEQERAFEWLASKLEKELTKWYANIKA